MMLTDLTVCLVTFFALMSTISITSKVSVGDAVVGDRHLCKKR